MRRILAYIPLLLVCLLPALGHSARAAEPVKPVAGTGERPEELDREAKRLFTAGKYAEAIELLNRLYRETNNPIYLRNIGRSYQRMRDPDHAISSFEEYLLRGRELSATERDEVRGFIREMEALKRRQQSKGTASKPPAAVTSDRSTAPPAVIPAPAGASTPPSVHASPPPPAPIVTGPPPASSPAAAAPTSTPSSAPPAFSPGAVAASSFPTPTTPPVLGESASGPAPAKRSVGRTVGIVAVGLAGALAVAGGVVLGMAWSAQNSAEGRKCGGLPLPCNGDADTVTKRNRLSQIFLGSAAATGILGATLILLSPVPAAGQDGRMAGWTLSAAGRF